MASIGESVSFRDKLYQAHRHLLDCSHWVRHTKDGFENWNNKFNLPFDLTGSQEFRLVIECRDLLTDMKKIMEGDQSERRNDEPNQEGRVDNQHAPG